MIKSKSKIGFSEIGGIYISKNIQSDYHKHYAISIIISFGKPFRITTIDLMQADYKVALIQKNITYKLESDRNENTVFIHVVPYSDNGIKLSDKNNPIQKLDIKPFENIMNEINEWFNDSENHPNTIKHLINEISLITESPHQERMKIDERIKKSFDLIMQSENEKLPISQISTSVNLSPSHFARLFKKETEMTFRKFVLYSKLVKSIYSMYENNNLTEAAFIGGFADQPHFSRTYKSVFGNKPSSSENKNSQFIQV
jgi:AraC-like DNA-binding protein